MSSALALRVLGLFFDLWFQQEARPLILSRASVSGSVLNAGVVLPSHQHQLNLRQALTFLKGAHEEAHQRPPQFPEPAAWRGGLAFNAVLVSFRQRIIVRPLALAILDWQNWLSSQRGPLLTL